MTTQHFTLLSQPSPFLREIVSEEYFLELQLHVGAVKCICDAYFCSLFHLLLSVMFVSALKEGFLSAP